LFTLPATVEFAMSPARLEELRHDFVRDFLRLERNTTPDDATFLRILIESTRAKRGLEVGTATGYGAILMGFGFEQTGGQLITIESDPEMAAAARENIKQVKLRKTVTIIEGDALEVIPTLKGKFNFLFIDALKKEYLAYLQVIEPQLKPGSLIVADNVIQYAGEMPDFLDAVRNEQAYRTVVIRASDEKGDGMTISYRLGR
jgi:predicted O-methyltransferase YrrM